MSDVTYSPSHSQAGTPMINIQSTLRAAPDLFKNFSFAVLFGSNGNSYTTCTQSDMYRYTHILQNRDAGRSKRKIIWIAVNTACQGKLPASHFGHACHMFGRAGIPSNVVIIPKHHIHICATACCNLDRSNEAFPLHSVPSFDFSVGSSAQAFILAGSSILIPSGLHLFRFLDKSCWTVWGSQHQVQPKNNGSGLVMYVPRRQGGIAIPRTLRINFSRLLRQHGLECG